jgi:hypothetical protein
MRIRGGIRRRCDAAIPTREAHLPCRVFGPFRVVTAGNITARACNVTGSSVSVSGLNVHFVTFG